MDFVLQFAVHVVSQFAVYRVTICGTCRFFSVTICGTCVIICGRFVLQFAVYRVTKCGTLILCSLIAFFHNSPYFTPSFFFSSLSLCLPKWRCSSVNSTCFPCWLSSFSCSSTQSICCFESILSGSWPFLY